MRSLRRFRTLRKSAFETLEIRQVLAGNVSVNGNGGVLRITGDGAGNGIVITQTLNAGVPVPGSFKVTGVPQAGGATTVNGLAFVTVTGIKNDVVINMNDGDDAVAITNGNPAVIETDSTNYFNGVALSAGPATTISLPKSLFVNLGRGDDQLGVDKTNIGGEVNVVGGSGDNQIGLLRSNVGRNYIVNCDSGNDDVGAVLTNIGGDAIINTNNGGDRVGLGGVNARFIQVNTGSGDDTAVLRTVTTSKNCHVFTGSGLDDVSIGDPTATTYGSVAMADTSIGCELIIDTGSEADDVIVSDVKVGKLFKLLTGSGGDSAGVHHTSVGTDAHIDTGSDNDSLDLFEVSVAKFLNIFLGSGGDEASLESVTVGKNAKIDAGSDNDDITLLNVHVTDTLFAFLGSGDDRLCIGSSSAKVLHADGGSGNDQLLEDATPGNTFGTRKKFGIEILGACSLIGRNAD